jgi:cytochrome c-type biogenesis protein CcmH/NrfF
MGYLGQNPSSRSTTGEPEHRSTRVSRGVLATVFFALLVLDAGGVAAKSWSYDLAGELMSPYCPGRTLSSCPSPQAAELVQWMVVQEAAGATREEIIEILIERFGEEILGAPPAKGNWLWAYGFLILAIVAGGGMVVVVVFRRIVVRSGVSGGGTSQAIGPALSAKTPHAMGNSVDDDDLARLVDDDLAARG